MSSQNANTVTIVKKQIKESIKNIENPVAAFDADGTLWPIDMGETFFNYQINNKLVDLPANPWEYYLDLHARKPREAYLWLAQINKGKKLGQVQDWAHTACEERNFDIFSEQKEIIDYLHENKVEVYIVTASIKWAVEPAAKKFNIPKENVVGIVTEVESGIITDKQGGPITYREGKVQALRERINGRSHFFGSGNTMGDISLIQDASQIKLTISSAPDGDSNFESEQKLKALSNEGKWHQLAF